MREAGPFADGLLLKNTFKIYFPSNYLFIASKYFSRLEKIILFKNPQPLVCGNPHFLPYFGNFE